VLRSASYKVDTEGGQGEARPGDLCARVDVFLRQEGNDNEAVEEAVGRAKRYAEAGVDCVYPIGANEA